MGAHLKPRDAGIREKAFAGACMAELASAFGCTYAGMRKYCFSNGIKVRRAYGCQATPEALARRQKMAAMHQQGVSMADIGVKFKITRERVRQLLLKEGITAKDGGNAVCKKLAGKTAEAREAARRARVEIKWGVPFELAQELAANGTMQAFRQQQANSIRRAIAWRLTFAQWFAVWQASGKLHLRGRGAGKYCMSRLEDSGSYELGNVHVQLSVENSRDAVDTWRGKVKPIRGVYCLYPGRELAWLARVGKKSLGYFASAELAGAAREQYCADNGVTRNCGALGSGRGYTVLKKGVKRYQVQASAGLATRTFATPEEARAEYLRRCAIKRTDASGLATKAEPAPTGCDGAHQPAPAAAPLLPAPTVATKTPLLSLPT